MIKETKLVTKVAMFAMFATLTFSGVVKTYANDNNKVVPEKAVIQEKVKAKTISIYLIVNGEKTIVEAEKNITIEDFISLVEGKNNLDYVYNGDIKKVLKNNDEVTLLLRSDATFTTDDIVPFEVQIIEDENIPLGEIEIVQEGKEGISRTTTKVHFIDQTEIGRENIKTKSVKEPTKEIKKIGIAQSIDTEQGKMAYTKEYTMNATAYSLNEPSMRGSSGYTASGLKAGHGIVAVDPRVIPLGTKLYIEGYGISIAGDTGGAIKGEKIDLYYDNYGDAIQFGRRNIKVYILK